MSIDWGTVLASIGSSLLIAGPVLAWLGDKVFANRLERAKTVWQGDVQKEVEVFLGEKSAEREYKLEAQKRLYSAIGPLRFQLLLACKDVASRIRNYGMDALDGD